jgi:hypothetical protein
MNPKPFALLNHLTLPLIRDTFLTPGGPWIHGGASVPQTDFSSLGFATAFGRDARTTEFNLLPMFYTSYTRYFGFAFIVRFVPHAVN